MTDPYKVLGVSPDISDDDLKKAYRDLAKKYHPDNYANNPLSDLAEDKMKQINEAYDLIQKQRSSGGSSGGSTYESNSSSAGGSIRFGRVRELINSGRFSEADIYLENVPLAERGAEWCFLKGAIQLQRGWLLDARRNFEQACRMEPNNPEYRAALDRLSNTYNTANTRMSNRECSACDICAGLMCADCLCDCC